MKRAPGCPKTPFPFSPSTQHQLTMYALAAGAAGVAALALTPAEAKIVYKHVHKQIPPGGSYSLRINHDQIADLEFTDYSFATDFIAYGRLWVQGDGSNQVVVSQFCAAGLPFGRKVGPNSPFGKPGSIYEMAYIISTNFRRDFSTAGSCPWATQQPAFLGVKFFINGKAHYGWVRAQATWVQFTGVAATLKGFAYETVANKPIVTGRKQGTAEIVPGGLGDLAQGASSTLARQPKPAANRH